MRETISNIKTIYKYGREFKGALLLEIIGSIIGIAFGIALPILSAKQVVYLTDNDFYQLIIMTLVILVVNIIHAFSVVLIRKNTQRFTVGLCTKMQNALNKEILQISQSDVDNNTSGLFVQRLVNDTGELSNMFTSGLGKFVGIITSVGIFVSTFIINKTVFLFYLLVSVSLTLLHLIKARKVKEEDKKRRTSGEKLSGLTSELVRGLRDIKMLNAKPSFSKVLSKNIDNTLSLYLSARNIDIHYNLIIDILKSIFECLIIVLFVFLIKHNSLTIAMAIALYSYRFRLTDNFMELISRLLEEANSFNLAFERVFAILDNKKFKKETFGTKHIKNVKGDFEFKDVCFSYDDNIPVLDNMCFKVDAHTTVGFVGSSGAGKTTIFNLLCKLYDAKSGDILIDGHNINNLDEDSIRGNITVIGQSPYVFNMSIIDNMKLVKSNATFAEIKKACEMACLDDFISSLPEKYNTIIGEGGVNLSGGQRQRLAIARALLQKTKIILFDEATSALDNETQRKIQEAIDNLKKEYTIMIIAHRFSTILNCDKIFFIDKGKVLDSGTHQELLNRCKKYKKLYESEIKSKE